MLVMYGNHIDHIDTNEGNQAQLSWPIFYIHLLTNIKINGVNQNELTYMSSLNSLS